ASKKTIDVSIFDGVGLIRADQPTMSSDRFVLVEDLFVKPSSTAVVKPSDVATYLELRFSENKNGTALGEKSRLSFPATEVAWAGHFAGRTNGPANWTHLQPVKPKGNLPGGNQRGEPLTLD